MGMSSLCPVHKRTVSARHSHCKSHCQKLRIFHRRKRNIKAKWAWYRAQVGLPKFFGFLGHNSFGTLFFYTFKQLRTWNECHLLRNIYVYIHTYLMGHYNPSVGIINLASHTTYLLSINFIHNRRGTYSLKSTPNDRFFEKLFMAIFICNPEFLPEIC